MVKNSIAGVSFVVEYCQRMCKVYVLGIGIDPLPLEKTLGLILETVSSNGRALVAHLNITGLNRKY